MSNAYISKNYTNDIIVRIIASQVVLIALIALMTQNEFLFACLAVDFFLRAFTSIPSPLALVGKSIISIFQLKPTPVFAAPKKFAASLGLGMSLLIFIFAQFELVYFAYALAGTLVLCAFLEAAFKICLGCSIHSMVVSPFLNARANKS